jgi:hypothetical protein
MKREVELGRVAIEIKGWRGIATLVGVAPVVAALLRELSRPPAERRWHGRVLAIVPYDFRPPTLERVRNEFWNTESDELLTPRAFGVGWGINSGGIAKKLDLVA